uniref:Ig-like domain-containing protein n=1 Tax=Acanthochromis polyacanthus TaxID=80966 RepID=A0A3Q1F066_9TELE
MKLHYDSKWIRCVYLTMRTNISKNQVTNYLEVGGKLILQPEPFSDPVRNITWRLNDNIVGEWNEGQPLVYSAVFKDRASVENTTGVLEISNIMKTDSGLYTVEINNRIQDGGYDVAVIKRVPKPVVMLTPLTCTKESKSCFLSCGGDITEAGPVTFYFKKGDGGWEEVTQYITIMNDKDTQAVKKLSCRMKNPLGQKDSEAVDNPFYVAPSRWKFVVVVLGVLAVVAAVVAGGLYYNNHHKNSSRTPKRSTFF